MLRGEAAEIEQSAKCSTENPATLKKVPKSISFFTVLGLLL